MADTNWEKGALSNPNASADAVDWERGTFAAPADPGFLPTVKRTGGQMLTTLATSAEDVTGPNRVTKAIHDAGQGIIDANPAGVTSLGDVVEKPWLAVKEAVGQFAPQIGAAAAGGFAGARLGGALGSLAGPGGGAAGAALGGVAGSLAPIFTQEYGGIRQEQKEAGQEDKGRALAAAIPATALERVGMGTPLKVLKGVPSATGTILREAGHGVLKEGATEGAQNVIEQWGAFKDSTTGENLADTAFSAVMGGIGGGVMGAAGGAVGAARRRGDAPAGTEAQPPDAPAAGADPEVAPAGAAPGAAPTEPGAGSAAAPVEGAAGPLTPAEIRAFNNAYRREAPDPLGDLQARVRGETAYTSPDQVQQVSRQVEDAWLRDNVAQVDQAVAAAAPPADAAASAGSAPDRAPAPPIEQIDATPDVDRRVRERRVFTAAQNLIDAGAPNSAAVIRGLDEGLQRIGEQPMTAEERGRVQRMLDANAAFSGRTEPAPLPDAGAPPVDARADNRQLEALIPEHGAPRVPRSQRLGINPAAGPLSAGAAIAVDGGAHDQMLQMAAAAQAQGGERRGAGAGR